MHPVSVMEVLKQQYTSCMKVGTSRNLDLSREYHKKLFGPLFYSWWNCPLSANSCLLMPVSSPRQDGSVSLGFTHSTDYHALITCSYGH